MDIRTARIEAHHLIIGVGGKNIGPGQPVDLDEVIAPGVTVRDVFPAEYFEEPSASGIEAVGDEPARPRVRGGKGPSLATEEN
jgi:hypothetical protein